VGADEKVALAKPRCLRGPDQQSTTKGGSSQMPQLVRGCYPRSELHMLTSLGDAFALRLIRRQMTYGDTCSPGVPARRPDGAAPAVGRKPHPI
jgi:hypothetical protein